VARSFHDSWPYTVSYTRIAIRHAHIFYFSHWKSERGSQLSRSGKLNVGAVPALACFHQKHFKPRHLHEVHSICGLLLRTSHVVCMLGSRVSSAEMAEPIEMPFGYWLNWSMEPRIRWGPNLPREGHFSGAHAPSYSITYLRLCDCAAWELISLQLNCLSYTHRPVSLDFGL